MSATTVTVYRNGISMGIPGPGGQPGKRGIVRGWTSAAARRNRQFLMSVVSAELPAVGYAFTCTVRNCPPDSRAWDVARHEFLRALRDSGATAWHWVTEWQKRGVPHLHGCVFYSHDRDTLQGPLHLTVPVSEAQARYLAFHPAGWRAVWVMSQWCRAAAPFDARYAGQHIARITAAVGWLQYLAKHAARGARHYQRDNSGVPAAWRDAGVGRLWGKGGTWPLQEPQKHDVDFHAARRRARAYLVAATRARRDWSGLRRARRLLRCNDKRRSPVAGLAAWMSDAAQLLRGLPGNQDHHPKEGA